jgi:hypothetical protein
LCTEQLTAQEFTGNLGLPSLSYFATKLFVRLSQFRGPELNETFEVPGSISQLLVRLPQFKLGAALLFQKITHLVLSPA